MGAKKLPDISKSIARLETVPLARIVPYWRNPRDNNKVAVTMVKSSIEQFTYLNPIIVDTDMTIIAGHTRYKALQEMGAEEVLVMVSDLSGKQAKEYRIVDNKVSEYSNWIIDNIRAEYQDLPSKRALDEFFPTLMMSGAPESENASDEPQTGQGENTPSDINPDDIELEMMCPNCLNGFEASFGDLKRLVKTTTTTE